MERAETFRTILLDLYESLYRYGYCLTGSSVEAEELTQETVARAAQRWPQLREPERAKAWLFQILRNEYLHRIRDTKRRNTVSLEHVGDLAEELPEPPFAITPGELQSALAELEEGFRTPLILFYFQEFSYRDIAEQMDLPIGTVMSRLARAKAHLRQRLAPTVEGVRDRP
jgi:RNA polymerase sigma-70 factor (ECF subfamily)